MNSIQAAQARQTLSLVGRTRAQVPFFYCAAAADGDPVLLVAPEELDEDTILALVSGARRKRFVRGEISRDPAGLLLFRGAGRGLPQLTADLSAHLDEAVPGLRFARVDPA